VLHPDISDVVQAKRSLFFFNAWCTSSALAGAIVVPTQVVWSSSSRGTRHKSSLALSLGSVVRGSRSTRATVCSLHFCWASLLGDFLPWEDFRLGIGHDRRLVAWALSSNLLHNIHVRPSDLHAPWEFFPKSIGISWPDEE